MNAPVQRPTWSGELAGTRLHVGESAATRLPTVAGRRGLAHLLLVTDAGLLEAGHITAVEAALVDAGVRVTRFSEVEENPAERTAAAGAEVVRSASADGVLAIGGGSVLDAAKAINTVATNGGAMRDYWGYGKTHSPLLPSIAVPTTAGTGSDAQSYALISHDDTSAKMACGAADMRFGDVVLDPSLLRTVPPSIRATTAMDALSHAVESFVSRTANPLSRLYAIDGWRRLIGRWSAVSSPSAPDLASSLDLLWGAHLAGAAIEQSMLGAAHGCANPLTQRFGVTHGVAVGVMLPHVIRFNRSVDGVDPYVELHPDGADALADRVDAARAEAGLPGTLSDCGVPQDALDALAPLAVEQWTSKHNPRTVGEAEARTLYAAAW